MNYSHTIDQKLARLPGVGTPGVSRRIASCIAVAFFLTVSLLVSSGLAYDFVGTVEKISEPNGMTVNVTQSGTLGLHAEVEVLLDKPLDGLSYFRGKELQFDILGHDILGRPVCDAYLDGTDIREVAYCRLNPIECNFKKYAPYDWTNQYVYAPCYYGQCNYYYQYPYQYQSPWLPFF
ncbi:MAG: hypothetical protein LUQ59_01200 [Methanothrix sp.]|nr:hypothetical protein [Methanothrix sp.]